jgi:hypothetical protein
MKFSGLPWWVKLAVKIGLAILPLPYERIRSWLTGYRGGMESPKYAEQVFHKFISDFQENSNGEYNGTLLELGPGGSLLSGVKGRILGFDQSILIDVGDFASQDSELYMEMLKDLDDKDYNQFLKTFDNTGDVTEALHRIEINYLTDGLSSLCQIPDDSISFSFSNAVLEHVLVKEFFATVSELYRIHQAGTISTHQIDYKDHLGGSLNNLRFPQKLWESQYFPNSGFYTNRLRHQDVKNAFIRAGFSLVNEETNSWAQIPLPRAKIAADFQDYTDEELKIRGARLVWKKPIKNDAHNVSCRMKNKPIKTQLIK